ncbi:hypothetical protein HYALB_00007457 [Hymenoscyphus albidus]|uniref:Heme haloperoxidase family profile domain-containing protein n=1 Tax=Hymenoscyphus albidus TaxID=595503 RepID=A0A9N9LYB7_9HELO|nr:hypothetical protein HYALB_00007457 [Hymenoscyphus albidus]
MIFILFSLIILGPSVMSYPFVSNMPNVDSTILKRQQSGGSNPGGPVTCPFNPNHVPAPGISAQFPYNGAKDGLPGNGRGGYLVPAPGDTAHQYTPPGPNDIRGPCPGLNAAANHNFLAHDGITTFKELVDAQQNLYNIGYDLAVVLAVLGLTLTDGDIVTEKLSIGCEATSRTSFAPILTGPEPGLDGHNKFESDTSLTRNDFFLGHGDNFSFNGTLYKMMKESTGGVYNRDNLAKYRYERYQQSVRDNPNFYFGPLALLLFGAASFLYGLMPSGTRNYAPDEYTISTFFGAEKQSDGSYKGVPERIPDNWTNRVPPYSVVDVAEETLALYLKYPVLFGGRIDGGEFQTVSYGSIQNGILGGTGSGTVCLLYQIATGQVPSSLNGVLAPVLGIVQFATRKLGLAMENLGCPQPLT